MTTNLVIDKFVDPEEGTTKDLAVDRISCCDVQFDCGVRDTIVEYLTIRSCQFDSGKVVGLGGQSGDFVGRYGRFYGGENSSG